FKCGSCNNLMAVTTEHLGMQVRCPHCQQIVVAPTTAPSPPPPPRFEQTTMPGRRGDEEESIFSPPTDPDDIFGRSDAIVRVEMPEDLTAADSPAPVPLPAASGTAFTFTANAPPPGLEPTLTYTPPGANESTLPYQPSPDPTLSYPPPTETLAPDP